MTDKTSSSSNETLDIGDVARRSGFPASTLRYYEKKGLITSNGRHGLRRLFHHSTLQRLSLIALGRQAGFSLDEITHMLVTDGQPHIDRALLRDKANELDKTIKQLESMRDGLRHAAACKASHHLDCPNFNRILGIASKQQRRKSTST